MSDQLSVLGDAFSMAASAHGLPDDFTITIPDRHFTQWRWRRGMDNFDAKISEIVKAAKAHGYDVETSCDMHATMNHYYRFVRRKVVAASKPQVVVDIDPVSPRLTNDQK